MNKYIVESSLTSLSDASRIARSFRERVEALGLICTRDCPIEGERHKLRHPLSFIPPSGAEYRECMTTLCEEALLYIEERPDLSQWQALAIDINYCVESMSTFLMEMELVLHHL